MEKIDYLWLIPLSLFIITFFGMFWVLALTSINISFNMDEETRDYLVEHNYCVYTIQESYESEKPSYVFMGDCAYINSTLMVN